MLDVVIVGARGVGLKVLQILDDLKDGGDKSFNLLGFIDDNETLHGSEFFDQPVLGGVDVLAQRGPGPLAAVCPIGDPVNRRRMIDRLVAVRGDLEFPNAIHPSAQVSRRAELGRGNILSQNVVLQAGVHVGDFNLFNMAAVAGPMAEIGNFCTINGHVMVASEAHVGDYCYIGMGAQIMQRLVLAPGSTVGANAFVHGNTQSWTTVFGSPAKVIKRRKDPFAA